MATISENLQILKDSTDAIKQAIIDKGGTIEGDITTWADAIGNIQTGGGSAEEEITFTGDVLHNGPKITLSGLLSSKPEVSNPYLVLLYLGVSIVAAKSYIGSIDISNTLTVTIDTQEPLIGNEIPAVCVVSPVTGKIIPVTFIQKSSGGSDN